MPVHPQCSFCSRPANEVKHLMSGSRSDSPLICDRCTRQVLSAMAKKEQSEQRANKTKEPFRKPRDIKAYLDEYVIGQTRAKEDLAIAIYDHYKRREASSVQVEGDEAVEIQKSNVLLMGPSGTGKTELARTLARMLKVPFYVGDATRLTQSGYVGDDVESLLQGLLQDAKGDVEKASWGIVLLDECDKMAKKSGRGATGFRDVTGEGVQQALLKLIEGGRVPVPRGLNVRAVQDAPVDVIDTSNILFIFAGSFAGIEEIVSRRVNSGVSLGFHSSVGTKRKLSKTDVYLDVTEEDLLDFGLIPELLGRLPVRTSVLELTEEEMVQILTEPKHALIKQKRALFAMDGVQLQFDPEALLAIAKKAKAMETGARGLRTLVEQVLRPFSYATPSDPTVASIRITEETLRTGEAVILRRPSVATA